MMAHWTSNDSIRSLKRSSGPLLIGHPKSCGFFFFSPEMLNFTRKKQVENDGKLNLICTYWIGIKLAPKLPDQH